MNRLKCPHMDHDVQQLSPPALNKLKTESQCHECNTVGPNFWICLHRNCLQIGCPENVHDHNTLHFRSHPTHAIHMNVSSQRVWCYLCEQEVFLPGTTPAALVTGAGDADRQYHNSSQQAAPPPHDEMSSGEEFDYGTVSHNRRQYGGLVGLKNLANTCYMNAALQALSNTPPLTGYFLDCGSIVDTLQMQTPQQRKSELAKSYHRLIKEMWCRNRRSNGYVVPSGILHGIRVAHPMFRGYQQHDTQEFLRCFMDQLHEELKEVTPAPPRDLRRQPSRRFRFGGAAAALAAAGDHEPEDRDSNCSTPSPSEAEYETCDSGVSEQSQLSDLEDMLVEDGGIPIRGQHQPLAVKYSSSPSPSLQSSGSQQRHSQKVMRSPSSASTNTGATQSSNDEPPTKSHRSIISDVFDGKLLSSVQCLTCDRVSTREETFQDLSLPIPGKDHLSVLHKSQSNYNLPSVGGGGQSPAMYSPLMPSSSSNGGAVGGSSGGGGQQMPSCSDAVYQATQDGWLWWLWHWMKSWFWGPPVTLHDCMGAFFSADELKNDNMYSCEKCKKLRNGIKYSRVLALPEMLCVHLKRFRHDLSYSSKISSPVHFPLTGLDMRPYLHKDCRSEVSQYDLTAVICHHGTVGGGHYTSYAKHEPTGSWFEYDDQLVTKVSGETVQNCEPYVLFYKKTNPQMQLLRAQAMELVDRNPPLASDIRFFVSKGWFNRFNTFAEPGPIDNWALLCPHGGLPPCKAGHLKQLVMPLPQPLWDFLYEKFGGGPACNRLFECDTCRRAAESLSQRQMEELEIFTELKNEFHRQEPSTIYAISMHWFRQWQLFARGMTADEPGPINNTSIASPSGGDSQQVIRNVKPGSDYAQIDVHLWRFFRGIYGGGPEIVLRGNPVPEEVKYAPREVQMGNDDPEATEQMDIEDGNECERENRDEREAKGMVNGVEDATGQYSGGDHVAAAAEERKGPAAGAFKDEEMVGDQPSVFGLTNQLKETMLLGDEEEKEEKQHIGDGPGDNYAKPIKTHRSSLGLVNGTMTVERKKGKGLKAAMAEKKEKHRLMKSNGLFGAEGTFVLHSSDADGRAGDSVHSEDANVPLLMDVNGEAPSTSHGSEEGKRPRSHGKAKGRRGAAGGGHRKGRHHATTTVEMHLSDSDK